MGNVLSPRAMQTETCNPDKVGRAEEWVERRLCHSEREKIVLAGIESQEAAEPEIEEPAPPSNWPERQAEEDEAQLLGVVTPQT